MSSKTIQEYIPNISGTNSNYFRSYRINSERKHVYERNENFYTRFLGFKIIRFLLIGEKDRKKTERPFKTRQNSLYSEFFYSS